MRKSPPSINQTTIQTSELSKKIPKAPKIESRITNQPGSAAPNVINKPF